MNRTNFTSPHLLHTHRQLESINHLPLKTVLVTSHPIPKKAPPTTLPQMIPAEIDDTSACTEYATALMFPFVYMTDGDFYSFLCALRRVPSLIIICKKSFCHVYR